MQFTKFLRDGVRSGAITSSVRVWTHQHVKSGKRYRMEGGQIEIDSVTPITFADITRSWRTHRDSRVSTTCSK